VFFPRQRHFLLRPRGSPGRPPSTCPPTFSSPTPHFQPMGELCQRRHRQDSPGENEPLLSQFRSPGQYRPHKNSVLTRLFAGHRCRRRRLVNQYHRLSAGLTQDGEKKNNTDVLVVKFDTQKLPAILNSLETENNGQKLVLEVSVRSYPNTSYDWSILTSSSNTWERTSSAALLWTVRSNRLVISHT